MSCSVTSYLGSTSVNKLNVNPWSLVQRHLLLTNIRLHAFENDPSGHHVLIPTLKCSAWCDCFLPILLKSLGKAQKTSTDLFIKNSLYVAFSVLRVEFDRRGDTSPVFLGTAAVAGLSKWF